MYKSVYLILWIIVCVSCQPTDAINERIVEKKIIVNKLNKTLNKKVDKAVLLDSVINEKGFKLNTRYTLLNTKNLDTFVNMKALSDDFLYDIKYATTDNFANKKLYECDACYLRLKTALALLKANKAFLNKGYKIKFFDCYRPFDVQQALWDSFPNPRYLSNPKKGSIHNRGGAVDITLVDVNDNEVDMGTPFDYFGKEAHRTYTNLPLQVLKNREMLTKIMVKNGFWTIRTEWWHFNYSGSSKNAIENFKWPCP